MTEPNRSEADGQDTELIGNPRGNPNACNNPDPNPPVEFFNGRDIHTLSRLYHPPIQWFELDKKKKTNTAPPSSASKPVKKTNNGYPSYLTILQRFDEEVLCFGLSPRDKEIVQLRVDFVESLDEYFEEVGTPVDENGDRQQRTNKGTSFAQSNWVRGVKNEVNNALKYFTSRPLKHGGSVRAGALQLLLFNEESLVSASHQLALITSLPFVLTARKGQKI